MLALGAGGLDVAIAMAGGPAYLKMPGICRVELHGRLQPWVSAKDIILELLRRLSVRGGVGKIFEYGGDGTAVLTVPERATIANMGAELGATTSLFPSDAQTLEFLKAQGRAQDWLALSADSDAEYDEVLELDLNSLEPLVARPHAPDAVASLSAIGPLKVDQVIIGSCTNSSFADLQLAARILKGRTVHPDVSLVIAPGSRQVLAMLAGEGALSDLIAAGARILECACGPCIGMGQSPAGDAVSLRTFNRNFMGRSGTPSASIYLVSPATAALSAVTGMLSDPRELGPCPPAAMPGTVPINDSLIIPPPPAGTCLEIQRGPNIKPFPIRGPLQNLVTGPVLIKLGDNITTDQIMPSYAKLLPFRSNIAYLSDYCLAPVDSNFAARARQQGGGFILAGMNYGQGSSREHAALVLLQLGIQAVVAISFARIHLANLINNGIVPLIFSDAAGYGHIRGGDELELDALRQRISEGRCVTIRNRTTGEEITAEALLSTRQREVILSGGLLNYIKDGKSCGTRK
jgi:aconitate hydratase